MLPVNTPSLDGDDVPEFKLTDDADLDAQPIPEYVTEEPLALSQKQYKTAEIADAVLGTEPHTNPADIEALTPHSADPLSGFTVPCDEGTCARENTEGTDASDSKEGDEPLTLEMIHSDSAVTEDQNSTETAKTYKVNCDKRNITGMVNYTVHVLNASQVREPLTERNVRL